MPPGVVFGIRFLIVPVTKADREDWKRRRGSE
jgi:hypothetical protein